MNMVCKDVDVFQKVVDTNGIKTDLSEKIVKIIEQGKTKYGARAWSTQIVKLLEDKIMKI